MKFFLALIAAACLLSSCGGESATPTGMTPAEVAATPQVTEVGTPSGERVEALIGSDGGTISSIDGMFTIRVPAHALEQETTVSIQAISVQAAGAVRAWRLAPEGTTFAKPVELVISYGSADVAGSAAEALNLGYQNPDGSWSVIKQTTLDTDARTLTASSRHFSDWSLLQGLQLLPIDPRVNVGKAIELTVNTCRLVDEGDELVSLLALCEPEDLVLQTNQWSVNGISGGNATVGTVAGVETGRATFTAPKKKPTPALVAVSTVFSGKSGGGRKGMLVSNVTIVDTAGWSGTVSYSVSASETYSAPGGSGSVTTTTTTEYSVMGEGSIALEAGGLLPTALTVSGGSGTWSESTVETTDATRSTPGCPYVAKVVKETLVSGMAEDPAFGFAVLSLTGSSYQLSLSTLGGPVLGTMRTASTPSADAAAPGCVGLLPLEITDPYMGEIPTESLVLEGSLDPNDPNTLEGSQTFTFGSLPVRTYVVNWLLKQ